MKLGDRRSQGQILGHLGLLHCKRGRIDQGLGLVQEGREHLEAIANETDLAVLLCQSAEGHALAGDEPKARLALEEAKKLAERSKGGEAVQLKSALERGESLLAADRTRVA